MTKSGKNIAWVVGIIIVVVLIVVATRGSNNDSGPIKIGFIGPLSGGAASYGESAKNAVVIAVTEINQSGGINGRQIDPIYEDGKCSDQDAVSAAQKLVNIDNVKYLIVSCSNEAFSIIPIINSNKVFAISPIASAPKLSGMSPYFMRNNPNDNLFGVILADYVASSSYKTVATISEQTDYAQGIKAVFLSEIQKKGLGSVSVQDYTSDTSDFRSMLSKLKSSNPDAIFINAQTGAHLVEIAKQARQLGITSAFVGDQLGPDPAVTEAGSLLNGMVFADELGLAGNKGQTFMDSYQKEYNSAPVYPFYAGAGYDDVYLIAQAISSVGNDTTKVEQYLHTIPNYTGTIGTYSFDQNGDIVGVGALFHKIINGKLVNI